MVETKKSRPPPRPSRGSQLLSELAAAEGSSSNKAGEKVGADSGTVSKWRRGLTVPNAQWRAKIEDNLGIPFRAWDEPAVEDKRKARKKRAA